MKNKRNRLKIISDILRSSVVGSQEELLKLLKEQHCEITQATLSRDLKVLKVAKTPLSNGTYKYVLPSYNKPLPPPSANTLNDSLANGVILSLEFSQQLAVLKTKPGYASAIAWDIDNKASDYILGTIAGDDTILVVPREGVEREVVVVIMNDIFGEPKAV